jgi:hypothetical protein
VGVRPGVWLCFACDPEDNLIELDQYDDLAAYRRAASGAAAPGVAR